MDCNTARLLLDFARPHAPEVDAADVAALDGHLAGCPLCAALAADARRLDAALGQAMRRLDVPDRLRQQLLNRLEADRSDYYRRWYGHGLRAAIAAAVLFAVAWGAWSWRAAHLPEPDLEGLRKTSHDVDLAGYQKEDVERFYRGQGVDVVLPAQLDYRYLQSYGMAPFQGRQVPCLVFLYTPAHKRMEGASARAEPGTYVQVYVLSGKQFNLEHLKEGGDQGPERYERKLSVVIQQHPSGPYAYVCVSNGDSSEWIWIRGGPAARS